jgi:hypothetical protein
VCCPYDCRQRQRRTLRILSSVLHNYKSLHTELLVFLDIFHRPAFFWSTNTTFRKLDLFPSSGEGGRRHLLSWAPLRRVNLNPTVALSKGPSRVGVFFPNPSPMDGKKSKFPKRRVSTPKNTGRWKMSQNPVILCAINHRQNPL